jgi:hypothetical protein
MSQMIISLKSFWKKRIEKPDEILAGLIGGFFIGLFVGAHNGFFRGLIWGAGGPAISTFYDVLGALMGMFIGVVLGAIAGIIIGSFPGAIIGIFVSPFNSVREGGIHGLLVGISLGVIRELFERNFFWLLFNYSDIMGDVYFKVVDGYGDLIFQLASTFIRAWFGLYTFTGAIIGVIIGIFIGTVYSSLANLLAQIIPSAKVAHMLQQSAAKRKMIDRSKVLS